MANNRVSPIQTSNETSIEPGIGAQKPKLIERFKTRITTLESGKDFASFVNQSYILVYPVTLEPEIPMNERKKPIGRIVYILFITAYLWAIFGLCGYVAYYDDPVVYSKYGSPYYMTGKAQIITMFFMLFILIPALGKIVALDYERKDKLFIKEFYRMLFDGSNGGLNDRNVKKMAWRIALIADFMCKIGPTAIALGYGSMHTLLSCFAMIDDKIDESVIPYIMTGISYSLLTWYMTRIYITAFTAFYMTQKFLQYRFEEINSKIEASKSAKDVINAIQEHDHICSYQVKNNVTMSVILGVAYYIVTPMVDFMIYQAIYVNSIWFIQTVFILVAIIFTVFLYVLAYSSATLYVAAHAPYKRLNAIMAKKEMSRMERIKIAFYIERFSGPEIATYCFDFFALNNYEFYLFIAAVCTNYFLIVGLIG